MNDQKKKRKLSLQDVVEWLNEREGGDERDNWEEVMFVCDNFITDDIIKRIKRSIRRSHARFDE